MKKALAAASWLLRHLPELALFALLAWACADASRTAPAAQPDPWEAARRQEQAYRDKRRRDLTYDSSCFIDPLPAPRVTVHESLERLPVEGDTPAQLQRAIVRAIRRAEPSVKQPALGLEVGVFDAQCDCVADPQGAVRGRCTVNADSRILAPSWTPHGDAKMRDMWLRTEKAILKHENTHRAILLQAAEELAYRLDAVRAHSCPALDRTVGREVARMRREEDRRQDRFHAVVASRPACRLDFTNSPDFD